MILARPFCSIDLCDLVFYQCVFVFCLITASLLALCFSHSVTGRGEKNLCNVHVLSHSYWRHTWIDRKGSGTTAMCGTDVLMIGSMKQRGWMRSAVEMEMVEMVQQGREGFDTFLKRASRISLTWDCILMEGVKTPRLRFLFMDPILSFCSHSPVFFPFLHFSYLCFGGAPKPNLLQWPADSTNSFTAFRSKNHTSSSPLCTPTTPCPSKHLDTLCKDLPGTSSPSCHCVPVLCLTTALRIAVLPPALVIFLYLFCVNTAHTY